MDPGYEPPDVEVRGTLEHFMSFVEEAAPHLCWYWLGPRDTAHGYGTYYPFKGSRSHAAHRIAYLLFVGPIPEGYEIDHVCHTMDESCERPVECLHHACVNPSHLEPVTAEENRRRARPTLDGLMSHRDKMKAARTHCKNGHELTPDNISLRSDGRIRCKTCNREERRAAYQPRVPDRRRRS